MSDTPETENQAAADERAPGLQIMVQYVQIGRASCRERV